MPKQSTPGMRETGASHTMSIIPQGMQYNCHKRVAIKRQWLERTRETGPSHIIYRTLKNLDKLSRHRAVLWQCPQKANCNRQANAQMVYTRDEGDRAKPHYVYHPIRMIDNPVQNEGRKQKPLYKKYINKNEIKQSQSSPRNKRADKTKRAGREQRLSDLRKPRTPRPLLPSPKTGEGRGEGTLSTGEIPGQRRAGWGKQGPATSVEKPQQRTRRMWKRTGKNKSGDLHPSPKTNQRWREGRPPPETNCLKLPPDRTTKREHEGSDGPTGQGKRLLLEHIAATQSWRGNEKRGKKGQRWP